MTLSLSDLFGGDDEELGAKFQVNGQWMDTETREPTISPAEEIKEILEFKRPARDAARAKEAGTPAAKVADQKPAKKKAVAPVAYRQMAANGPLGGVAGRRLMEQIASMLHYAAVQRQATFEHQDLDATDDYRSDVTSRLRQLRFPDEELGYTYSVGGTVMDSETGEPVAPNIFNAAVMDAIKASQEKRQVKAGLKPKTTLRKPKPKPKPKPKVTRQVKAEPKPTPNASQAKVPAADKQLVSGLLIATNRTKKPVSGGGWTAFPDGTVKRTRTADVKQHEKDYQTPVLTKREIVSDPYPQKSPAARAGTVAIKRIFDMVRHAAEQRRATFEHDQRRATKLYRQDVLRKLDRLGGEGYAPTYVKDDVIAAELTPIPQLATIVPPSAAARPMAEILKRPEILQRALARATPKLAARVKAPPLTKAQVVKATAITPAQRQAILTRYATKTRALMAAPKVITKAVATPAYAKGVTAALKGKPISAAAITRTMATRTRKPAYAAGSPYAGRPVTTAKPTSMALSIQRALAAQRAAASQV